MMARMEQQQQVMKVVFQIDFKIEKLQEGKISLGNMQTHLRKVTVILGKIRAIYFGNSNVMINHKLFVYFH